MTRAIEYTERKAGGDMIEFKCSQCGADMAAPQSLAGQPEKCPKCGSPNRPPEMPNEDPPFARQLAEEWLAERSDAKCTCLQCGKAFAIARPAGVPSITCPFCGYRPGEKDCERIMNTSAERREREAEIKRLGELLSKDSPAEKAPWFKCPFCREDLPASLAEGSFAEVECPRCHHVDVYVYNGEAFRNPRDCQRVLESRLKKRKKAEEKAREQELAKATKDIGTATQPDGGQTNGGYVYALLNSTMPGLVKIGKTEREPDDRAKELSNGTGIPTPFVVAYAEWFNDCSAAEDSFNLLCLALALRHSLPFRWLSDDTASFLLGLVNRSRPAIRAYSDTIIASP